MRKFIFLISFLALFSSFVLAQNCGDGTPVNECADIKPLKCVYDSEGNFYAEIDDCNACGCLENSLCNTYSGSCYREFVNCDYNENCFLNELETVIIDEHKVKLLNINPSGSVNLFIDDFSDIIPLGNKREYYFGSLNIKNADSTYDSETPYNGRATILFSSEEETDERIIIGECASTKPLKWDGIGWVDDCGTCGCSEGYVCNDGFDCMQEGEEGSFCSFDPGGRCSGNWVQFCATEIGWKNNKYCESGCNPETLRCYGEVDDEPECSKGNHCTTDEGCLGCNTNGLCQDIQYDGCPSTDRDTQIINLSKPDEKEINECASTKPLKWDGVGWIDDCKKCGCSEGYECSNAGSCYESDEKCDGCLIDDRCTPYTVRIRDTFCDLDGKMKEQRNSDAECNNNYECESNVCVNNQCIGKGFLEKVIAWFNRLFG